MNTTIYGVGLTCWSKTGTITHVVPKSETTVWSSGGGGYVDPQYGGVIHAPQIHSQTTMTKELRLACDDGSAQSVTIPDEIRAYVGERASVIWARASSEERGCVHGFKNHREGASWYFDTGLLKGMRFRTHPARAVLCAIGTWSRLLAVVWIVYSGYLMSTGRNPIVLIGLGFAAIIAGHIVNEATKVGIARKAGQAILTYAKTLTDARPAAAPLAASGPVVAAAA